MAHEITSTDHLVLNKEAAWHGIGTVVEQAPSPGQALTLAKLDWKVEELPLLAREGNGTGIEQNTQPIVTHKALRRSDNQDILSIVGSAYQPLQNEEMAEFCYALADEGNVEVESAGSLKGGNRVWFLLKSDTMCVGEECDEVAPYVLCFNSNDGSSSVEFMPTTVRVVCNNTLTWARAKSSSGAFRFRHTKNMKSQINEATQEMRECFLSINRWKERMNTLAEVEITQDELNRFFFEAYNKVQGKIPTDQELQDGGRIKQTMLHRAHDTIAEWQEIFDHEHFHHECAPTRWLAMNAVTNWLDHSNKVVMTKRTQHTNEDEARQWSNLFGRAAKKKSKVLQLAQGGA